MVRELIASEGHWTRRHRLGNKFLERLRKMPAFDAVVRGHPRQERKLQLRDVGSRMAAGNIRRQGQILLPPFSEESAQLHLLFDYTAEYILTGLL